MDDVLHAGVIADAPRAFVNEADPTSSLTIVPVSGRIGAEISGVNLGDDLDTATVAAIKAALVRHKVIFFREQHLDDAAHEGFAAKLGSPVAHPTVEIAGGSRFLIALEAREGRAASVWHTDVTFLKAYPEASILRSLVVPAAGGDTMWANCETAYRDLPEALRNMVDGLWAVHTNDVDLSQYSSGEKDGKSKRSQFKSTIYETVHPVVRVHPESGEKSLLLGLFVKNFIGFNASDSRKLLDMLQSYIAQPENTIRWKWKAGDVAIWDNRSTQHRVVADFDKQHRSLRRATIAGDIPRSVGGRSSYSIEAELEVAPS